MDNTNTTFLLTNSAHGEALFTDELRQLLNARGVDNACATPDYILADYLRDCLRIFAEVVKRRDGHDGLRMDGRGKPIVPPKPKPKPYSKDGEAPTLARHVTEYPCGEREQLNRVQEAADKLAKETTKSFTQINEMAQDAHRRIDDLRRTHDGPPIFDNKSALLDDGVRYDLPSQKGGRHGTH